MMSVDSLIFGFMISQKMIEFTSAGIDEQQALTLPENGGNCINWILGHVLRARGRMIQSLGGEIPEIITKTELYNRGGAREIQDSPGLLSLDVLRGALKESNTIMIEHLKATTDEQLKQVLPADKFPVPVEVPTLGNLLNLLLFHESYHTGQIGFSRRLLGLEPVIR